MGKREYTVLFVVLFLMVVLLPGKAYSVSALDTGFDTNIGGVNPILASIAVQPDGKILVGGYFTTIGGVTRNHIARLNADGTLDTGFNPNANYDVSSIVVQADGKILIGGGFYTVGGVTRHGIARVTNTDAALQELSVSSNGSTVTWMRGQASSEVWWVTFEHSADGVAWTSLGNGTRITGGWQITGISLPIFQNHYVRALGYAASGWHNGSGSLFESVQLFYLTPSLLYGNFAGYGLYSWNGSAWTQINTVHPTNMVAAGSALYADFAAYGLYSWNGTTWTQINTVHPASVVAN